MSRLTEKDYKEWVYVVGTTINQKASEHLNYINHKLGELEDLEDDLGCPLNVVFKALKNDTIRYKDWICQGISLYYNGAGRWCFSTSYNDEYDITRYIDEIDVATYGIDWFLID